MVSGRPVVLLWTGGWDSTFRLLQLLLLHRLPVAPLYLLDDARASAPVEIRTMQRIRKALAARFPHTRGLLRPTTIARVSDLAPDAAIDGALDRLADRDGIGTQYGWLARYYRQRGWRGIELACDCIPKGASAVLLERTVATRAPHGYGTYRLDPGDPDVDVRLVFGGFGYPLIATTREHMLEIMRDNDWTELMGMTWFCHRPAHGVPCGLCKPCRANIEEGFGWRIPRRRRALSAVYRYTLLPVRMGARRVVLRLRVLAAGGRALNIPRPARRPPEQRGRLHASHSHQGSGCPK